ncbi:hypothetical protein [uncultured Psychrobacter sp.]|uniref:hypothetical protein n=1 Tax=uncultured Psychrobacter sp. TaxID=259303 RepID=UPI00345A4BCE
MDIQKLFLTSISITNYLIVLIGLLFILTLSSCDMNMETAHEDVHIKDLNSNSTEITDQIISELSKADVYFDHPKIMTYGEEEVIMLNINPNGVDEEKIKEIFDKYGESVESIIVSNRMKATLIAESFEVKELTTDIQAVSNNNDTTWKWSLLPHQPGNHNIHLALIAYIEINNRETPLPVISFDRTIKVEISYWQRIVSFYLKNWQWIWSGIMVPVVLFSWEKGYILKK